MDTHDYPTVICSQCQHEVTLPKLDFRQRAVCPQCGHTLVTCRKNDTENPLAFAFSALIFLALSLPFNFLSFRASGQQHHINLPGGLEVLVDNDYLSLAIITGIATVVLPGMVLLGVFVLSSCRLMHYRPRFLRHIFHWVKLLQPWSMAEIFLVGTLVSLIKITSLADVGMGLSFYAFIGFTACMTICLVYFDHTRTALWLYEGQLPQPKALDAVTASKSIQRTWALLITAALLYIPANTLPIMHMELFGVDEPNTIIGGVFSLWESGSYPVALVILVASVIVPVAKIAILLWLNYSVHTGHVGAMEKRTRYYRFTEWIGRWSMIDVFVVAVLVALIQLGNTLSFYPGPAALAFCGVVFITMVAAMTFDSRLIWTSRKPE